MGGEEACGGEERPGGGRGGGRHTQTARLSLVPTLWSPLFECFPVAFELQRVLCHPSGVRL